MSRFREELGVIPMPAWVIAGLSFIFIEVLMWQYALPNDSNVRNWPFLGQLCLSVLAAGVLGAYVLLVGYVSGDAKRRGMRPVLWTLIAIFVPNCIGIILYFFMREPLMACCPKCGTPAKSTFAFCHQCGTEIHPACPKCRRPVEATWKACAFCGSDLVGRTPGGVSPANSAPTPGPVG